MRKGEDYAFSLNGAAEVLLMTDGTRSEARNIGAEQAKGDELLFLDNDMDISNINLQELNSYNYAVSTAYFSSNDMLDTIFITSAQNWQAAVGLPLSYYGGFMYVRKADFNKIGPFKNNVFMEDIEFANRAVVKGYHINVFPYRVLHTRKFSGPSLARAIDPINLGWGISEVTI